MGFAFSRLAAFARGERRRLRSGETVEDVLARRKADAHPDAPPRRPLFASQDLGHVHDADLPPEPEGAAAASAPVPAPAVPPPAAPASAGPASAVAGPAVSQAASAPLTERPLNMPSSPPMPERAAPLGRPDVAEMTLGALAERFEQGLQTRVPPQAARAELASGEAAPTLAEIPAEKRKPVNPAVERDVEDALREALSALRAMSAGR